MEMSRDEVIKGIIHHKLKEKSMQELNHDECFDCPYRPTGKRMCESITPLLEDVLELLEEQEAVGWIKVSDRLPFSSEMVLVSYPAYTDEAGNQYVEGVGIGYLITTATNKYWCRSDGTTFGELGFSSVNPIAWMPLPSPMKGGEQDG